MTPTTSATTPSAGPPAVGLQKFDGGRLVMLGAAGAGALGLVITFAGMAMGKDQTREAMFSYLLAFAYWGGIALASLVLLQMFHATRARWMVVLRRALEINASTVILFLALFVPLIVGMKSLYSWVDPASAAVPFTREGLHILEHKSPYLNVVFFVIRGVAYLLLAGFVSNRLLGWSTKQDEAGGLDYTVRQRRLGIGALPFVALTFSFAAFDWLMSLEPLWFSTMFGIYFFAGSFISAISLLAVIIDRARGKDLYTELVTPEHVHSVGKLMLGFTCFWGYIGFSQFMLIWIAGLPEETPFFIVRLKGGWAALGVFLIFGHFFIPFGALLSRSLKRNRKQLALVGLWILLVHAVDLYWLIMPTLDPGGPVFPWTMVPAFVGVGGLAVAFAVWRLRGRYTLPVRDPYLADSLAYRQP